MTEFVSHVTVLASPTGCEEFEGSTYMKKLEVTTRASLLSALRFEIDRLPQMRFAHRLHCVLLVGAGQSCYQVAALFGDSTRSVERWVHELEVNGIDGLREKPHPGRPASLVDAQVRQLALDLKSVPPHRDDGPPMWNGRVLREEVLRRFGVAMSVRNSHRLLKTLSRPNSPNAN